MRITWNDLAPLTARLEAGGLSAAAFPSYLQRVREANARRVREGDLDHFVFYLLQSTRFTTLPPIEPALSAKALVDGLDDTARAAFRRGGDAPASRVPPAVRSRAAALLRALDARRSESDARLTYFRDLVTATFPAARDREAAVLREYLRVMRFVYEKEFGASRAGTAGASVDALYRVRGLSTDTAVEAGYVVDLGLGVAKALEPDRRIRRVLIVGPGLDLAPRTGLIEAGPPESYQPWAVVDALLALGLSRADDLETVCVDINPRVVRHLENASRHPPVLRLVSGIGESASVSLTGEYRAYFARLGTHLGERVSEPRGSASTSAGGHLRKTVRVAPSIARLVRAVPLDIVTERLDAAPFDLAIATNILPYFDDVQLAMALTNLAAMLAPGGVLLHNEGRPVLQELAPALGLPFEQSRRAIVATVPGAPAPLSDSVWLHRRGPR